MPARPSLSDALTRALAAPPPAWDRVLGLTYGGVTHGFSLTVEVKPSFDLSTLEQAVTRRWPPEHGAYARGGRTIRFSTRQLVLVAEGTAQAPPDDDDGLQSALLLALVEAARGAIVAVTTDRWTDSPFEEPPARRRTAADARDFVEALVPRARSEYRDV